jgi:hypothetical protein
MIGPTVGETFAAYQGVPDEYPGGNDLARELDDAMWEAGMYVLRERQAEDPVLRAMMDDRYRLWELVDGVPVGNLPPGIEIIYRADHKMADGVIQGPLEGYHPTIYANVRWRDRGNEWAWRPSIRLDAAVQAWLPVPLDVSALIAAVATEGGQEVPRPPRPPRPATDWSAYDACTRPGCWVPAGAACIDVRSTWSTRRRNSRRPHPGRPRLAEQAPTATDPAWAGAV